MRFSHLPLRTGLAALVLLAGSALAAAAEIEAGLPENTTAILTVNLKQLLHAPVIKQHGLASLRQMCRNSDGVRTFLEALAFDPFHDLDRLTVASVGVGKNAEGVFILRGRFDTARFHLAVKKLVKGHNDRFARHKVDNLECIYIASTGGHGSIIFGTGVNSKKGTVMNVVQTKGCLLDAFGDCCLALVDKNTLVVATSEELLKQTCKRIGDKDTSTMNKPMRRLMADLDSKQTILFALRPDGITTDKAENAGSDAKLTEIPSYCPSFGGRGGMGGIPSYCPSSSLFPSSFVPPPVPEPPSATAKEEPSKSSWELSGGISVAEDFTFRCAVRTQNADDARTLMKGFEELRLRADGLMMFLAGSSKEFAFLKGIPRSFAAVRKGRILLVEGRLPAETLVKLLGTWSIKNH